MLKPEMEARLKEVEAREKSTNEINARLTVEVNQKNEIIKALIAQQQQTLSILNSNYG